MESGHEQCTVQRVAQQLCVRAVQTYRKERFEQPQESPFWEGQPLKGWYQITTNKTGCPPLTTVHGSIKGLGAASLHFMNSSFLQYQLLVC